MIVELIVTYFLISNDPLYSRSVGPPYKQWEIRLEVNKHINEWSYVLLEPYIARRHSLKGSAGGEAEIGLMFGDFKFGLYHRSDHTLDVEGKSTEVDGIRFRWRMK